MTYLRFYPQEMGGDRAHLASGPDLLDLALRIFSTTCRLPFLAASSSSASFPILLYYLPHISKVFFLRNMSTVYCVRSIDQQQPSLTPPPPTSRQPHYSLIEEMSSPMSSFVNNERWISFRNHIFHNTL